MVDYILRLIPPPPQRQLRAVHRQTLETTVAGVVGSLAVLVDFTDPDDGDSLPFLKVSKDRSRYSGRVATYRQFLKVYNALKGNGLIEPVTLGHFKEGFGPVEDEGTTATADKPKGRTYGTGFQERVSPTAAFVNLVRDHGIAFGTAAVEHFPSEDYIAPDPVQVRHNGELIAVPPRDAVALARMRQEMAELNAFIREVRVTGTWLGGWVRRFTANDDDPADWRRGGRLYADPWPTYQSLSEGKRVKYLRLEGEPVVEIDIRASFLTIAYALRGRSLLKETRSSPAFPDPYIIEGFPRDAVKAWVTASFGNGKALSHWPEATAKTWKARGILARDVKAAVLKRHPILKDFTGLSWGPLQRIESDAIVAAMLRLKRGYGVPALPVHDSLLVPQSAWQVAAEALRVALVKATGQEPLPFKFSPRETSSLLRKSRR